MEQTWRFQQVSICPTSSRGWTKGAEMLLLPGRCCLGVHAEGKHQTWRAQLKSLLVLHWSAMSAEEDRPLDNS